MDPTRFEGTVRNAVADAAKASGAPADWADRIRGYQLREVGAVGSGRYELMDGNRPFARPSTPIPETTKLSADQETQYRGWLDKIGMTQGKGFNLDGNFTGRDYDLRGFFKKYGPVAVNVAGGQHFTDEFKLPNHATFSDQSQYAAGNWKQFAGHWTGDTYVPSANRFRQGGGPFVIDLKAQYLPGTTGAETKVEPTPIDPMDKGAMSRAAEQLRQ
jgi:hypothetical protein